LNHRILLIGSFAEGALESSYAKAFERSGYEPFCFDADKFYRTAGPLAAHRITRRAFRSVLWAKMNRTAIEIAACVRPSMIFAIKCCFLAPDTIRLLRRKFGIPIVNYYPDHPYCGVALDPRNGASTQRRNLIECFREYSTVWIWENTIAERLRRDGVEAHYLPFGVDRDLFNANFSHSEIGSPVACLECHDNHKIVFIGHFNRKRGRHISEIKRHRVALWGNGWQRMGRNACSRHHLHRQAVAGHEMKEVYSGAAVSLNVVGDLNIPGHNMRTFEVPASGGVMLSHYTKEQAAFFPEGEAAAYYRTPEELDEWIERLTADSELRQRIRLNGSRLATQHHYEQRAVIVLRHFGLPVPTC